MSLAPPFRPSCAWSVSQLLLELCIHLKINKVYLFWKLQPLILSHSKVTAILEFKKIREISDFRGVCWLGAIFSEKWLFFHKTWRFSFLIMKNILWGVENIEISSVLECHMTHNGVLRVKQCKESKVWFWEGP